MRSTNNGCVINHGGTIMLRNTLFALCLALFAFGCGKDNVVDVNGTLPVDVSGANNTAVWDPDQCFSDEDCSYDKLCVLAEGASEDLEFDVYRCEAGCDVEFFTVMNEDGTGATTKDGDSCQRDGDTTVFCHPQQFVCTPYTVEPEPVDPVEPQAEFYSITCCWDGSLANTGKMVNFGAGVQNPSESGGFHWNIPMDEHGCGTSTKFYAVDNVTRGFWTKLTQGEVANGQWLDGIAPKSCTINSASTELGSTDAPGCGYGLCDAVNEDGTSDSCLE